jgi:hypothetical protein
MVSQHSQRRGFVVSDDGVIYRLPAEIADQLNNAQTPEDVELIIAKKERAIAKLIHSPTYPYIYCDHAAELMSRALARKGIIHRLVVGWCDEGSSHAYVIVNGKRYDPTHQGFGNGQIEDSDTIKNESYWDERTRRVAESGRRTKRRA